MIVFLDTSVMLKLYIVEAESDAIRSIIESGADVAVSSISYVEAHSALARRSRDGSIGRQDISRVIGAFEADWFQFWKVHVDDSILRRAGKLCLKYPLRSIDAVQLAAALLGPEIHEEPFVFLTSDKRIETVARQEKLRTQV